MLGSIIGDIIGSRFELNNTHDIDFELFTNESKFTDDTVLTVAVSNALVYKTDYALKIKEYGLKYPNAGYGKLFKNWLFERDGPKGNSYGNGSAMRVSPIAYVYDDLELVLNEIEASCLITHNHEDAIRGAKAIGSCIFLANKNKNKEFIKSYVENNFHYNLDFTIKSIRGIYKFDSSCNGSVPQAIVAFLEADSFIDSIKLAISIGGDSDTIAAMTGAISEAYYKVIPEDIICNSLDRLTIDLKDDILKFYSKYTNILILKGIEFFELPIRIAESLIENKSNEFSIVQRSLIGVIDERGEKIIYNDGTKLPNQESYSNRYYEKVGALVRRKVDNKLFLTVYGGGYLEGTSFCWPPYEIERPIFIECTERLFNSFFSILK